MGSGGGVGGFVVSSKVVSVVSRGGLSVVLTVGSGSRTSSDRSASSADVPVVSELNGVHAGGNPC